MNTNTWARPIVIPWDASPISHANRALRPARSDSPDLFLVQQRRVFALVEDRAGAPRCDKVYLQRRGFARDATVAFASSAAEVQAMLANLPLRLLSPRHTTSSCTSY